eukprot:254450_1
MGEHENWLHRLKINTNFTQISLEVRYNTAEASDAGAGALSPLSAGALVGGIVGAAAIGSGENVQKVTAEVNDFAPEQYTAICLVFDAEKRQLKAFVEGILVCEIQICGDAVDLSNGSRLTFVKHLMGCVKQAGLWYFALTNKQVSHLGANGLEFVGQDFQADLSHRRAMQFLNFGAGERHPDCSTVGPAAFKQVRVVGAAPKGKSSAGTAEHEVQMETFFSIEKGTYIAVNRVCEASETPETRLNVYSLIMDIKLPKLPALGTRLSLFQPASKAAFFVDHTGALRLEDYPFGTGARMQADRWHRVCFVVNLEAGRAAVYLDGQNAFALSSVAESAAGTGTARPELKADGPLAIAKRYSMFYHKTPTAGCEVRLRSIRLQRAAVSTAVAMKLGASTLHNPLTDEREIRTLGATLVQMGHPIKWIEKAFKHCGKDRRLASDWILANQKQLENEDFYRNHMDSARRLTLMGYPLQWCIEALGPKNCSDLSSATSEGSDVPLVQPKQVDFERAVSWLLDNEERLMKRDKHRQSTTSHPPLDSSVHLKLFRQINVDSGDSLNNGHRILADVNQKIDFNFNNATKQAPAERIVEFADTDEISAENANSQTLRCERFLATVYAREALVSLFRHWRPGADIPLQLDFPDPSPVTPSPSDPPRLSQLGRFLRLVAANRVGGGLEALRPSLLRIVRHEAESVAAVWNPDEPLAMSEFTRLAPVSRHLINQVLVHLIGLCQFSSMDSAARGSNGLTGEDSSAGGDGLVFCDAAAEPPSKGSERAVVSQPSSLLALWICHLFLTVSQGGKTTVSQGGNTAVSQEEKTTLLHGEKKTVSQGEKATVTLSQGGGNMMNSQDEKSEQKSDDTEFLSRRRSRKGGKTAFSPSTRTPADILARFLFAPQVVSMLFEVVAASKGQQRLSFVRLLAHLIPVGVEFDKPKIDLLKEVMNKMYSSCSVDQRYTSFLQALIELNVAIEKREIRRAEAAASAGGRAGGGADVALDELSSSVGKEFQHSYNMDTNGIVYWLGTNEGTTSFTSPHTTGRVAVSASSWMDDSHDASAIVGRQAVRCVTKPLDGGSHIVVDFLDRTIRPSHYTLRHYASWDTEALRSWNFEGSNDGEVWKLLKMHKTDQSLRSKGQSHTWALPGVHEAFSMFRIRMTGKNSNEHWYLACSGFEIYGVLDPEDVDTQKRDITLIYDTDFDHNGLLYYLGSNQLRSHWRNPASTGQVIVRSSPPAAESADRTTVVGREAARFVAGPPVTAADRVRLDSESTVSLDESGGAWVSVSLSGAQVAPSHYTLRHHSSSDDQAIRNWRLLASENGADWQVLSAHHGDKALKRKGAAHTWQLEPLSSGDGGARMFAHFRLEMTGPNSSGGRALALSGFELYGKAVVEGDVVDSAATTEFQWRESPGISISPSKAQTFSVSKGIPNTSWRSTALTEVITSGTHKFKITVHKLENNSEETHDVVVGIIAAGKLTEFLGSGKCIGDETPYSSRTDLAPLGPADSLIVELNGSLQEVAFHRGNAVHSMQCPDVAGPVGLAVSVASGVAAQISLETVSRQRRTHPKRSLRRNQAWFDNILQIEMALRSFAGRHTKSNGKSPTASAAKLPVDLAQSVWRAVAQWPRERERVEAELKARDRARRRRGSLGSGDDR